MAEIRDLAATEVDRAAAVLARAFTDDPLFAHVFPDVATRPGALRAVFTGVLRYGLRYGRVWTTAGGEGVAIRRLPGDVPTVWRRVLRAGLGAVPFRIGVAATARLLRIAEASEAAALRHMAEPFWYCQVLGVDPEHQGRGHGRRLTRHTFALAERDGLACYLETAHPRARDIHERNGWTEIGQFRVGGLTLWSMRRLPGGDPISPP